jgi:hypothetical protein
MIVLPLNRLSIILIEILILKEILKESLKQLERSPIKILVNIWIYQHLNLPMQNVLKNYYYFHM